MIKVNLAGVNPKKPAIALAGASMKTSAPWTVTPIILILIILGSAAVGYWWYSSLTGEAANLESKIQQELAEKVRLDAVIKQGEIYEARKKMLERRIKIIEGLQRNQISPVVALDVLSEAVDRTKYVWLSNVDQNNTVFSMNGLGTSLLAIADFYERRFGVALDPDTEVQPLIGSKEGLAHLCLAFIDPGDEALVPDPGYPVYATGIQLAGGRAISMPSVPPKAETSSRPSLFSKRPTTL